MLSRCLVQTKPELQQLLERKSTATNETREQDQKIRICADSNRWDPPKEQHKQTSHEEESGCKDIIDVSQGSLSLVGKVVREEVTRNHGIHGIQVFAEEWHMLRFLCDV